MAAGRKEVSQQLCRAVSKLRQCARGDRVVESLEALGFPGKDIGQSDAAVGPRAEMNDADTREQNGARAHDTRLECCDEFGAGQTLAAFQSAGGADCQKFSMCGGVAQFQDAVSGLREQDGAAVGFPSENNSAHGNFSSMARGFGFSKRKRKSCFRWDGVCHHAVLHLPISVGLQAPVRSGCTMPPRLCLLSLLFYLACATARFTHGASIGELSSTEALLWTRTSGPADLKVVLSEEGTLHTAVFSGRSEESADYTARVELSGLKPRTAYSYEIRISGSGEEVVTGRFRTAPAESDRAAVRFVFGGDIAGQNVCRDAIQGFPVFQAMDERNPDFFVGLGDLIYADTPCLAVGRHGNQQVPGYAREARTIEDFRSVWKYVREDALYQRFLRRVPMYPVWDDHEVRNDFSAEDDRPNHEGEPRLFASGARAFVEFNLVKRTATDSYYRHFKYGKNLELFLLDTRSRRDRNAAVDLADHPKTMLGRAQRAAFTAAVGASTSVWKVVASSVPLSVPSGTAPNTFGRDGWANQGTRTGYENELRSLLLELAQADVRNLVFLVTDVHFAAVHRYRPFPDTYKSFIFYEVITGPLQAGLFPTRDLDPTFRPERLFFYGPEAAQLPKSFRAAKAWFNFGEVDVDERGKLVVRVITAEGRTVFALVPPRR